MEWSQQFGAVAVVLVLLGACLWWLRRRGLSALPARRGNRRLLTTLERLPLGPQHSLYLVRMEEEVLLLGCSPAGCVLLTRAGAQAVAREAGA
jgi:flagellar biosynthetic protein FliO